MDGAVDRKFVANFIRELVGSWDSDDTIFLWPPDVFAVTSVILQRTGCYRHVLTEPDDKDWSAQNDYGIGAEWITQVSNCLGGTTSVPLPSELRTVLAEVMLLATGVSFDALRSVPDRDYQSASYKLSKALIRLHGIADDACTGFGLLTTPPENHCLAHCFANLLLTARGSLSALSKRYGVVLPKFRVPQSGLTLRSFSLHLTYHISEVEVIWRTLPWANESENSINILFIPWPSRIDTDWFRAAPDKAHWARYFNYEPPADDANIDLSSIISGIQNEEKLGTCVHFLVFPELALSNHQYRSLLELLSNSESGITNIPIVIAGVRGPDETRADSQPKELNQVRLAVHFADAWYDLSQRKHHRWKLSASQLKQYELAHRLSPTREWIENIPIGQRRITFLAPTSWLALTTLICEDLAQLEPVSEIIRGVGPNVLIALLLDGPQLKERWSARYAGVFADDPGTAVLSLTAFGMAKRSVVKDTSGSSDRTNEQGHAVGLWKDPEHGWETLKSYDSNNGILLTITAHWVPEYSADLRGGPGLSAAFKFGQQRIVQLSPLSTVSSGKGKEIRMKSFTDLRELSALTFLIYAALNADKSQISKMMNWLRLRKEPYADADVQVAVTVLHDCLGDLAEAGLAVDASDRREWPSEELKNALVVVESWLQSIVSSSDPGKSLIERHNDIITTVQTLFNNEPNDETSVRRKKVIALAVLAALQTSLEKNRRQQSVVLRGDHDNSKGPTLSAKVSRKLREVMERIKAEREHINSK